MLQPHWLDELFADPKGFPEKLVESDRFKKAVEMASKAFEESTEDAKKMPAVSRPSPGQAARVAFLNAITEQEAN